jgi:uncharacterized protein YjiS (DUF1127 family)
MAVAHHPLHHASLSPSSRISHGLEALARLGRTVALWRRRQRERAELARLDPRELRDIAVTPAEVSQEVRKPFWRA